VNIYEAAGVIFVLNNFCDFEQETYILLWIELLEGCED